jgi:hypothetical protein
MINTVVQLLQQYFFTWHLELTVAAVVFRLDVDHTIQHESR